MTASEDSKLVIAPVKDEAELFQALAIREVVFIEEQHVPETIERDAEDARAYHLLVFAGGHAIGTGRLVVLPAAPDGERGTWGQVGRMAVLQAHRKFGVGTLILNALESEARARGLAGIVVHAQLYALGFYEHHGYRPVGAVFDEAGIDHVEARKRLLGGEG
ncbi:MAG TPA: GNAT family N-acetyltransferase [Myxococcaceae bacterium]|nr:GNAT family N-acetyltransferase [Myxococcaceae bacterium]